MRSRILSLALLSALLLLACSDAGVLDPGDQALPAALLVAKDGAVPVDLTVRFPGLSGVKVEVRQADGAAGSVGSSVQTLWNQSEEAMVEVLQASYDVRVTKGAMERVVDDVDCAASGCSVDDLIRTAKIELLDLSGVKVEFRKADGVPGTVGGSVLTLWNQSGTVVQPVLRGIYDVRVTKGAIQYVVDQVDCTEDCLVDGLVRRASVDLGSLTGIKVEFREADGAPGSVGGSVLTLWNQSGVPEVPVLPGRYDLRLTKGAMQYVIDGVDCGTDCAAGLPPGQVTASLRLQFPGLSGIKVELRAADGAPESVGGSVQTVWNQGDETALDVLKGIYDVRLGKGAISRVLDGIDCSGDACEASDWATSMTVHLGQDTGVKVELRAADGVPGTVGGSVQTFWNQTGELLTPVLQGIYDLRLTRSGQQFIVDDVPCWAPSGCVVDPWGAGTVNTPPQVLMDESRSQPEGIPVQWAGQLVDPDSDPWTGTVDYGDGTVEPLNLLPSKDFILSHAWAEDGTYTLTVTVDDGAGGVGTATTIMEIVNLAPTVDLPDLDRGFKGEEVSFTGAFTDKGIEDTHTITWDFGDGSPPVSGTLTPTHVFSVSGDLTVTLTVEDDDGGVGSDAMTFQIQNRPPTAVFTVTELSWNTFRFDASPSEDPDGDPLEYQWTLNGEMAGGGLIKESTFPGAGTYLVALGVSDGDGGAAEVQQEVTVVPPPASISTQEYVVTQTSAYETTPTLGSDATGEIVVYTSRESLAGGGYAPGQIWAQRLNPDGSPTGSPLLVSDGTTDDKLNEISGSRIVYTAFQSKDSMLGHVVVYDLATGSRTVVTEEATTVHEARIYGTAVVWTQGQSGSMTVRYSDLNWSGASPVIIGGPNPPATNVDIGSRFVVWESQEPDASGTFLQGEIVGYDLWQGVPVGVSFDQTRDAGNPSTFGNYVVWESTSLDGTQRIEMVDLTDLSSPVRRILAEGSSNVAYPSIDGDFVTWEGNVSGNYDVYVHRISDGQTFQVTNHPSDQFLNNVFGDKVTYVDGRRGSLDVYVSAFTIWP